ncbi:hypothetical protein [Brachyspira aalborgi]|uniref:Uncharacterized protein n=1 Tax=Brachyspira aalborgi TaxID=29522 RepID=A0A5C8EET2_9SPIR|nr:hypothetical protein [Brachyspira aalborgi]TXJ36216.1 hypothetical protein EPJ78_09540 [Brachyspira aalborgi]
MIKKILLLLLLFIRVATSEVVDEDYRFRTYLASVLYDDIDLTEDFNVDHNIFTLYNNDNFDEPFVLTRTYRKRTVGIYVHRQRWEYSQFLDGCSFVIFAFKGNILKYGLIIGDKDRPFKTIPDYVIDNIIDYVLENGVILGEKIIDNEEGYDKD